MERDLKVIFVLIGVILFVEYALVYWYPKYQFQLHLEKISGLNNEELQRSSDFQFSNARKYLQELTRFGARITGSDVTEYRIPEWLIQTIETIQTEHANTEMNIQWDVQRPSSHFPLDFLGGMHNVRLLSAYKHRIIHDLSYFFSFASRFITMSPMLSFGLLGHSISSLRNRMAF